MTVSRQLLRYIAAVLWCSAAFLAMPLAFQRLSGQPVALFGVVNLVTLPVLTLFAAGLVMLFPERLKSIFNFPQLKLPLAASALYLLITLFHFASGNTGTDQLLAAGFWLTAPLAAMVLSDELKKILPYFAAAGAGIFIYSGCMSEFFTGLLGNWNWLAGAITALLPGIFIVLRVKRWQWYSLGALVIFFLLLAWHAPERFPRSAFLGAVAAAALIYLRNRLPRKKFNTVFLIILAGGIAVLAIMLFALEFSDTRFIIWQGAGELFLNAPLTGCGNGMFAEYIRPHLPSNYFFSPFPAAHIDHAHNDLLNLLAECGIAGAVFYLTAICTVLRRREKTPVMILAQWAFLVMIVCGCFDQHNLSVAGAFITALCAGLLLAPRSKIPAVPSYYPLFAAAGIVLIFAGANLAKNIFNSSMLTRKADLELLQNNTAGAMVAYRQSIKIKPSAHAIYQMAQLHLGTGQPEKTLENLALLQGKCHLTNFRHAPRLKAIAAFSINDLPTAINAMHQENINAPWSIISADFQRFLLRKLDAADELIEAGDQHFADLCKMRQISPEMIYHPEFTEIDDGAFPENIRQQYAPENDVVSGMIRNLAGAILLMLAVWGIGNLLLFKLPQTPLPAVLACGMIFTGAMAIVIPPEVMQYMILLPVLPGIYFAIVKLKKYWKTALIFTLICLPFLAGMLLPPSGWDDQVYQIALLKKYAAFNSTAVLPDNPYSAYPSLGQLWILPGFMLGKENVPQLVLWIFTIILAGIFYHAGCRYGKYMTAVALGAVMLSPLTWNIIRAFYVETFLVLFAFAGVLLLLSDRFKDKKWQFILAGAMAGAAASVKLPGLTVAFGLLIFMLIHAERRRYAGFFILGAAVAALPFFLRVWIYCGNPVYPFGSALFNGGTGGAEVEKFFYALGSNYGVNPVIGIILNWWETADDCRKIFDGIATGFQFTLLPLIVLGALIWSKGQHKPLLRAVTAFAGAWIFWNLSSQQSRFLYPLLWAGAFLVIYAATALPLKLKQLAAALLLAATMLSVYLHYPELNHYILAWNTVTEARKAPGHYAAWCADETAYAEAANQMEELKDFRLATLWDRRTLYLPAHTRIIMPGFQEELTPVPPTADELYNKLKNFDFLLIRMPAADVDKAIEFSPDAVRMNELLLELLRTGKAEPFRYTSDGQLSILRIVPET